jgi:hypothetical protein
MTDQPVVETHPNRSYHDIRSLSKDTTEPNLSFRKRGLLNGYRLLHRTCPDPSKVQQSETVQ